MKELKYLKCPINVRLAVCANGLNASYLLHAICDGKGCALMRSCGGSLFSVYFTMYLCNT